MMVFGILQVALLAALVLAVTKPLGVYMARVYSGERTILTSALGPVERLAYRVCGVDPSREMGWASYTLAFLAFSMAGTLLLYALLRLQGLLPLNPQHAPGMSPALALNTAVSFVTNTNWQAYSGERQAGYLVQMAGLTWQNFVSAAAGMAIAVSLMRGLTRRCTRDLGNFWVDLTRGLLYILLPLSVLGCLVLVSQGVIQTVSPALRITTMEGARQTIPMGPVASQEIIKMLGTNGGGFFNANSAHPFENPTPFSNLIEMLAIFAIPAGMTYTFGRFARDQRQGWSLFAAMAMLCLVGVAVIFGCEQAGNPILRKLGADQSATALQSGGNMEGKEVRFGIANSALFATLTTDASCGAVNSSHDSFTPLAGGMAMLNIALGEVVFGGVGAGFIGVVVFAILAVFIAGLMVGRTPEFLGKKIESREMKLAMLYVLVTAACILAFSSLASIIPAGLAARLNRGPHGLSEILYAFTSATGNNGSAFAGLGAGTAPYNLAIAFAMLVGRFMVIIPLMAIAGSLARKATVPATSGTFPTTGGLFVGLLVGVIVIVGALTFFPAYALGPVVEHLQMHTGRLW